MPRTLQKKKKIPCNLLSVSHMVANSGYSFIFTEEDVYAIQKERRKFQVWNRLLWGLESSNCKEVFPPFGEKYYDD